MGLQGAALQSRAAAAPAETRRVHAARSGSEEVHRLRRRLQPCVHLLGIQALDPVRPQPNAARFVKHLPQSARVRELLGREPHAPCLGAELGAAAHHPALDRLRPPEHRLRLARLDERALAVRLPVHRLEAAEPRAL
eukprot:6346841-Prymnesium_polylepis.1